MARRSRRFKDARDKRDGATFVPFPHAVWESVAFRSLSAPAAKLFGNLLGQYRGDNNGDLCAAYSMMRAFGWRSEQTLFRARRELEAAGLIVETRAGARPNRATLYAFTFFDLDESPKLEMTRRSFPRGQWRMKDPLPALVARPQNEGLTATVAVERPT